MLECMRSDDRQTRATSLVSLCQQTGCTCEEHLVLGQQHVVEVRLLRCTLCLGMPALVRAVMHRASGLTSILSDWTGSVSGNKQQSAPAKNISSLGRSASSKSGCCAARSAWAFLLSCGSTAPASLLRAKRPRTRGRESASVLRHWYFMRLLKLRSCRFCRYLHAVRR